MKQMRPVSLALAVLALCSWSVASSACDQNKAKTTNASTASMKAADASCSPTKTSAVTAGHTAKHAAAGHVCTAEMAANCTAEMAAACAANGSKSARNANYSKASKMSADCCMSKGTKATATTAMMGGEKTMMMNAGAGASCGSHGAKTTAMTAGAGGSCAAKGAKTTAMTAGAGHPGCTDKSSAKTSSQTAHGACDACADFSECDMALREMGAVLQVVPLKNGVMYVYTTDPAKARTIQTAMAQRKDQMAMFASASSGAALCGDCKQLRGAAMSGKLAREVVNIEGGCLTLMTSGDAAVVAKIHALAGVSASRAKI
ncbi:MAG: hypothetical protein ABIS67_03510 [Candidatus Eisenbacteria bacterium]